MFRPILFLLFAATLVAGCGENTTAPSRQAGSIDQFVTSLSYDEEDILNVQDTGGKSSSREVLAQTAKLEDDPQVGQKEYVTTDYDLKRNFDKVAILRPTNGIVFPGALVKANQSLMNGIPDPAKVGRAPVTLSIDLPGMGDHGVIRVENPTNSSVGAAIDKALQWWNANAYEEGYYNAANSVYQSSSSYSEEQAAMDVGLNLEWATGDVSSGFKHSTSSERHTVIASYQQAFYTVTYDTPLSAESVFAPDVPLSRVESMFQSDSPPAYIQSVTYGRILMFRMESSSRYSATDIEAAFNYGVGTKAAGKFEAHYKSILQESSLEVLTIGGDAQVAADAVSTANVSFGSLAKAIRDAAVYSRSNPGVPIAYTARFLKDDSICRLGYTTEYTATECRVTDKRIRVDFGKVTVVRDCDVGDGDFEFVVRVKNSAGTTLWSTTGKANLGRDDKWTLPVRTYTLGLQNRIGNEFQVEFEATEWDGKKADPDMDHKKVADTYAYRSGSTWNGIGKNKTITLGSGSCKVELDYDLVNLK